MEGVFYKCLNRTLVMPEVLGPDALGKLIHGYVFYKCSNRTIVMPEVLGPDALGKLIHYYILPSSHFVCPLFHFEMSQNIVLFLKIKVINLLSSYYTSINLLIQFFDKFF